MQLKTILNRVEPFKSFVYGKARWVEGAGRPTLEVEVHARKNGRAICSGCGRPGPGYDRLPERRFEFVPLVGDRRVLRVCHAACGLPTLRRDGGASALGRGKVPLDDQLPLVPGPLGEAVVLGGGGRDLPHHLEKRLRVGKTRGFLGRAPSGPRRGSRPSAWMRSSGSGGTVT